MHDPKTAREHAHILLHEARQERKQACEIQNTERIRILATAWQNQQNALCAQRRQSSLSMGIRHVWSDSSLSAWRKLGPFPTRWVHSEDSDQTGDVLFCILDPPLRCFAFLCDKTCTCIFCFAVLCDKTCTCIFCFAVLCNKTCTCIFCFAVLCDKTRACIFCNPAPLYTV